MPAARLLVVGAYAGFLTAYFAAILLDVVHANAGTTPGSPDAADGLLVLFGLCGLVGMAALSAAAPRPRARNLLILSLALLGLELFVPLLLAGTVITAGEALGVSLGPWIRLAAIGGALAAALAGLAQMRSPSATQLPAA